MPDDDFSRIFDVMHTAAEESEAMNRVADAVQAMSEGDLPDEIVAMVEAAFPSDMDAGTRAAAVSHVIETAARRSSARFILSESRCLQEAMEHAEHTAEEDCRSHFRQLAGEIAREAVAKARRESAS